MSKLFLASLLAFLIGMACPVNRIDLPGQPQDFSILFTFGRHGRGNGQFNYPTGVAISPSGDIVVADTGNNRIQVFDSTGRFLRAIGIGGSYGDGKLALPYGVALSPTGDIVVADTDNHRVQVFDSTGKFLRKFGDEGSEDGQFGEDIINPNSTSEVDKIIQGL